MPISLGRESPTSTFISGANSFMMIHETVDKSLRPYPSLSEPEGYMSTIADVLACVCMQTPCLHACTCLHTRARVGG